MFFIFSIKHDLLRIYSRTAFIETKFLGSTRLNAHLATRD